MSDNFDHLQGFNAKPDINKSIHDHLYDDLDTAPGAHHHSLGLSESQAISYALAKQKFDELYSLLAHDHAALYSVLAHTHAYPAWADYTPTFTGWTGGTYTKAARWVKIGTTVHYWASITIVSLPSAFGTPVIGLPDTGVSGYAGSHKAWFLDSGNTYFNGFAFAGASSLQVYSWDGDNAAALISSTLPITWAVGDAIIVDGSYETAA